MAERRVRARVRGVVQGVGFRPHVFRLASSHGLGGFVRNDTGGVLVEVEGPDESIDGFLARIGTDAPPLVSIDSIETVDVRPRGDRRFAIAGSELRGAVDVPVSPDVATCDECLAELFDRTDRRYRYPFINCTNCGPRFTIVTGIPYDRVSTTMAGFAMCSDCRVEYEDPADRRFHAEPIACPDCGPQLRLVDRSGAELRDDAAMLLHAGCVVAVKGIGGYHLACLATEERAVATLRARKHREDKPFALMVRSLADARRCIDLTIGDEEALTSPARPIVVAPRSPDVDVAPSVAPHTPELGVMLPYSPVHHLLMAAVDGPLVMTSGNRSDEPIAYRDDDALERLGTVADAFLVHDRPIHVRTDDSVVRGRIVMRRSRGHVPAAIRLPVAARRPILAMGADLKSAFCLARGSAAWVSHHIGDLGDAGALTSLREAIAHFERVFGLSPEVVAHDLHPGYHSTAVAMEHDLELIPVQHHHAHLAACLAEHGETGPAVGVIYDGTGYGADGTIWGGEILVGDLCGFERAGHLAPVRMPGGEAAIREPWRMACAWLDTDEPPSWLEHAEWSAVTRIARSALASPITTSVGRLLDAVAAICGVRTRVTYEGQAAIELEAACDQEEAGATPFGLSEVDGRVVLDPAPAIASIVDALRGGEATGSVAARFHNGLADTTATACVAIARRYDLELVALSGGVFQNRLLLERTFERVEQMGLRVLVPRRLPPNDGGVAFGQAAIAAARR
jgi:hydrogenase maturation protein HypF